KSADTVWSGSLRPGKTAMWSPAMPVFLSSWLWIVRSPATSTQPLPRSVESARSKASAKLVTDGPGVGVADGVGVGGAGVGVSVAVEVTAAVADGVGVHVAVGVVVGVAVLVGGLVG